ncbi:MAG TPA: Mrp/NBP35 family ATP-binding protein [Thermodesulfobacteriota bacterium]|nr:Mrp/NBP35 family ATP-binding protein [Thermodesulfobacteriota bacterium]
MELNPEGIRNILKKVKYPGFSRDIVSFGIVKDIQVEDSKVTVSLLLPKPDEKLESEIRESVRKTLLESPGVSDVEIQTEAREPKRMPGEAGAGIPQKSKLPDIKYFIAVASGKGGVGKSTVAVNLALAISKKRKNVGLMDADIWGPSIPIMTGVKGRPKATEQKIIPLEKYGLKLMSIGFLIDEDDTVIWRGPMVHGAVKQFIEDVEWKGTDYLVIDLPPGTGDAQLSLIQTAPLSGGIIVTTPQDVALIDVRRGVQMFRKLNVPVIGIVENMSYLVAPGSGEVIDIFGRGGGRKMAEKFNVPFLGEIPIDPQIRKGGDEGTPIVESHPESPAAKAFMDIAEKVLNTVESD